MPPEAFPARFAASPLRYAAGQPLDLDAIEKLKDGYAVTLLYYPNPDSLMPVRIPVSIDACGKFSLEEMFRHSGR